ncbi:MAG: hypothetical protein LUQ18_09055, partial [Methylococcaceae bacterium]|nr:hypothetical protein [Methylococcaceae bacterium]
KQAIEVFDFTAMQHSIDAQWSLSVPDKKQAEISYHEHQAYSCYLEQEDNGNALKQWLTISQVRHRGRRNKTASVALVGS